MERQVLITVRTECEPCQGTGLRDDDYDGLGWGFNVDIISRLNGVVGKKVDGVFVPDPPIENPRWVAYVCRSCNGTGAVEHSYKPFISRRPPKHPFVDIFKTEQDVRDNTNPMTMQEFLDAHRSQ